MMKLKWLGASISLCLGACTTLGPMPMATGVSPLPVGRPGVEVQIGAAPGFYLSSSVSDEPKGSGMPQLSALFEPDELIGVPGLYAAGRIVGNDDAGVIVEPMLGYRRAFDDRFAGGALLYGTHASGDSGGASYSATRVGIELGMDVRLTPRNHLLELHAVIGAAATGIAADGSYCLDSQGRFGIDCDIAPPMQGVVDVDASGIYPAGQLGVMLDIGKHRDIAFHGVRLGLIGAVGTMPTAVAGTQTDAEPFASLGLLLTVGVGSSTQ